MIKVKEDENIEEVKQHFFYPPQDGFDAFVCDVSSQEEADRLYKQFTNQSS